MKVNGDYTCEICGASFETNVAIAGHVANHQRSISADSIIEELQRLADQKGRAPTQPEVNEETEFTSCRPIGYISFFHLSLILSGALAPPREVAA